MILPHQKPLHMAQSQLLGVVRFFALEKQQRREFGFRTEFLYMYTSNRYMREQAKLGYTQILNDTPK